jgi:hypothetical protein
MRKDTAKKLWSTLLAPALGLGLLLAVWLTLAALLPGPAHASDPVKTGYVVVRFGAHDAMVRAFTFTTSISSYVALQRAGVNPVAVNTAWGLFLCGIEGVGRVNTAGDNCDNGAFFWSTWYWDGAQSQWASYMVGVGDGVITQDGHIDGYVWTDQWPAPEPPYGPGAVAAYKGLEWLRPLQDANTGGYGTPNDTLETLLAVVANHYDPEAWRRDPGKLSLLAAVTEAGLEPQHAGEVGKLATALAAAGSRQLPSPAQIRAFYDATTGLFNPNAGFHAWAMIGLRALGQEVPAPAVQALKDMQKDDGGWAYGTWNSSSDTNGTALAIQALIAAGEPVTSTAVVRGLNYLEDAQNADGGFPWDPQSPWGTASDTNSTAYVVQAIVAAGEDPTAGRWEVGGNHPMNYLVNMQLANGAFEWQPGQGANQLATQQAIPALLHRPFPFEQGFPEVGAPGRRPE